MPHSLFFRSVLALMIISIAACGEQPERAIAPATDSTDARFGGMQGPEDPITIGPSGRGIRIGTPTDTLKAQFSHFSELAMVPKNSEGTCFWLSGEGMPFGTQPIGTDSIVTAIEYPMPDYGDEFGLGWASPLQEVLDAYGDRAELMQTAGRPENYQTVRVANDDGFGIAFFAVDGRVHFWRIGFADAVATEAGCPE